ncbi:hypothetical protein J6590_039242 [Homalodisca vitripennis]|nr:hypothetical protein J6590_039242 [Homalodisca vitripennis]
MSDKSAIYRRRRGTIRKETFQKFLYRGKDPVNLKLYRSLSSQVTAQLNFPESALSHASVKLEATFVPYYDTDFGFPQSSVHVHSELIFLTHEFVSSRIEHGTTVPEGNQGHVSVRQYLSVRCHVTAAWTGNRLAVQSLQAVRLLDSWWWFESSPLSRVKSATAGASDPRRRTQRKLNWILTQHSHI